MTTPAVPLSSSLNQTTPQAYFYLQGRTIEEFQYVHRPQVMAFSHYVMLIWYVIGLTGNLMAFTVWIQRPLRHSSGIYLAGLAMADFIFLVLHIIHKIESNMPPGLCELFPVIFLASQYIPAVLVLAFTIERYISICHPFQREKFCKTSIAINVTVCLAVFMLLLHAIQGYFWIYNRQLKDCNIRSVVQEGGVKSLWSIWTWTTEVLNFVVVPLATLALNVRVIMETRRLARDEERRLHVKKGKKGKSTTVMLLTVSFYLIFTTVPVTTIYALYAIFPEGDWHMVDADIRKDPIWQRHLTYMTVKKVIEAIGMSHYALNFYIYLLTGRMFREEVQRMFFRWLTVCKIKEHDCFHGNEEKIQLTVTSRKGSFTNGHPYGTPL